MKFLKACQSFLARQRTRQVLAATIIIITLAVFGQFFATRPELLDQVVSISPLAILAILLLYALMLMVLAAIYELTLKLCGHDINYRENLLLTGYSSIVNFFGPLQSGPGFRAVYLKARYRVRMRDYATATLLYYAAFAVISGVFIVIPILDGRLIAASVLVGATGLWLLRNRLSKLSQLLRNRARVALPLVALTAIQLCIVAGIYAVELASVGQNVTISKVLIYTGSANFALFVSLTPGALGFRESFLYATRQLHGFDANAIVSANVIDRGLYVVFLGLMFGLFVSFKLTKRFSKPTG